MNVENTSRPSGVKSATRFVITKLVLENFKSYAGVKEIGPFHKNFSAIVGPNGSGKSNVLDAILFVFGKNSNKLRMKKLVELIHRSDSFPDLDYCSVSVHFCDIIDIDENEFTVVEGSEIIITRTVKKSSSTAQYLINKKKSTREAVETLLSGKGIDLEHNRFMILQGEVEQIALMKPKAPTEHEDGLLEFIEEIIGTNTYKAKIEDAEKKIENLNEERAKYLNRVKSAEKEKDNLEGAKNEAEEYLNKQKEMCRVRHTIAQKHLFEDSRKFDKYKSEKERTEAEYTKFKAEREKAEEEEAQVNKEYKKAKGLHDDIAKKLAGLKSEFEAFERREVKLTQDITNAQEKKPTLAKEIKDNTDKVDSLKKKAAKLQEEKAEVLQRIEELTPQLAAAEQEVEKIRKSKQADIEPLRIKIEEKKKELMPFSKKMHEFKQRINVAQSEIDIIKSKSEMLERQASEASANLGKFQEDLKLKKKEKATLQEAIGKVEKRIPDLKNEVQKILQQEEATEKEYHEKKVKLDQLKEASKNVSAKTAVYKALMKEKDKGTIDGIHDRLGSLGTIDKKYDVAISTACSALDHILVENTDAGKQCVEFLRKNNMGFGFFLLMDKICTSQMIERSQQKVTTPENIPRLYDLVKPKNQKYKPVFFQLLGTTLVAENLDQATRIAYGNNGNMWRVVTLKGEIVEMSGTISGGGKYVAKGGMSASMEMDTSKEELQTLEQQVSALVKKLQELASRKIQVSEQAKMLEAEYENCRCSFAKIDMDEKALSVTIKELQKRVGDYDPNESRNESDEERVLVLQEQIKKYKQSSGETENKLASIEKEIQKLQNQIEETGGIKFKQAKERVEKCTLEIDELNKTVTKLEVQIETAQKNASKLEKQIKKDQKELNGIDDLIEKLEQEKVELETEATQSVEHIDAAENQLEVRKKELAEKEKIKKELTAKFDSARLAEVSIKQQYEDAEKKFNDCQKKIKHWTSKVDECEKMYKELEAELNGDEEDKPKEKEPEKQKEQPEKEGGDDNDDEEDEDVEMKESAAKGLKKYTPEELDALSQSKLHKLVEKETTLNCELNKMKPNMSAIQDYRKKEREYNKRLKDLDKVTEDRNNAQKTYDDLRKRRLDEFMSGFSKISLKLKEIYQMITLGGDAELELVDTLDPFSEGIIFSVRPPKKSWKNIANLSGGEKTLSSLALIFALHHYKPTPIYIMDEIDAALDFKNVSIIANYIKDRTKNAQFLIISLRNNMFELADILVGIYKTHNVTKSVTVNPHLVHNKAQQELQRPPQSKEAENNTGATRRPLSTLNV